MAKLAVVTLLFAVLCGCSLYAPEYAGVWIDATTIPGVTITLDFEPREFFISVETYDAVQDVTIGTYTSGVLRADSSAMLATITGQIIGDIELGDAELQAYLTYIGGSTYYAAYSVDGDILSISGDLIKKITFQPALEGTKNTP